MIRDALIIVNCFYSFNFSFLVIIYPSLNIFIDNIRDITVKLCKILYANISVYVIGLHCT